MTQTSSDCPFLASTPSATQARRTNRDWWPNQLDLSILHQHSAKSDRAVKSSSRILSFRERTTNSHLCTNQPVGQRRRRNNLIYALIRTS